MTHVSCRLTARNWDQLWDPMLGSRVWATFTFLPLDWCWDQNVGLKAKTETRFSRPRCWQKFWFYDKFGLQTLTARKRTAVKLVNSCSTIRCAVYLFLFYLFAFKKWNRCHDQSVSWLLNSWFATCIVCVCVMLWCCFFSFTFNKRNLYVYCML